MQILPVQGVRIPGVSLRCHFCTADAFEWISIRNKDPT